MSDPAVASRLEAVRAVNDALEARDRDAFRELVRRFVHPECEWSPIITAVEGGGYRGREGMMDFFDDLAGSFAIRYLEREYRPVGDDLVLFLTTMELRGVESGATVEREGGFVFEFEDGMLRRARAYDSHQAASAHAEAL